MTEDKPRVTIYTDGGADPNPGPGGWAAILTHETTGRVRELSGGDGHTTNNRMELTAAIRALEALTQPCVVRIFTDSEYLRSGITRWVKKWAQDGWRRGRGKKQDVENADLWQRLLALAAEHEIAWEWVKGHAGDRHNERADWLATQEIRRLYAAQQAAQPPDAEVYLVVSARGARGFWAASVRYEDEEQLLTGMETETTSNRLDVLAACGALSALPEGIRVRVNSLSDYLRNGATQWLPGWKRRGWLTKKGEPVKNRDVWERLDLEQTARQVEWPPAKDDPALEMAFESLASRAQEVFEEHAARGDDFYPDEG